MISNNIILNIAITTGCNAKAQYPIYVFRSVEQPKTTRNTQA